MADALRTRPFDHVPVLPFLAGWAAAHFSKDPPARIYRDPRRIAEVQIKAQETLGFDGLFGHLDPLHIPEAFGCPVHFTQTGPLAQPLQIPLETIEQVDALTFPDPRHSGRLPEILQTARLLAEYGRDRVPFIGLFEGPFTSTCRLFEADRIMRMFFRNRPVLNRLLDRVTEFLLLFAQALRDQGARFLLIPEPTASASMIAPRLFEEWVLPRLRRIMKNIDLPCILHICGDTSSLLGAMAQTGARVLSLDQCMDLKTARAGCPEVALGGNVDPVQSLLLGSAQAVKEDTRNCLRQAGTERFILMSGCSVPPGTPEKNIRAMIEAAHEYGLGQAESSSTL
jgi:MtaA/CmuA family methyltransferase